MYRTGNNWRVEANQANGQSSGSDSGVDGNAASVAEEALALDVEPSDKGTDDQCENLLRQSEPK